MTDVERRVETFVDKFTPAIAAQLRDAHQRLRAHFPRGVEMMFDTDKGGARGRGAGVHGDQGRGREAAAATARHRESLR